MPSLCSNCWKATGDGHKIEVGSDAIKGMSGSHILYVPLIIFLVQVGLKNLASIGRGQLLPQSSTLWPHACDLGIPLFM